MPSPTEKNGRKAPAGPGFNDTAYMGLLLSFALILSYVEALLPLEVGLPGVKLGLANLAVVLCLYLFGWKKALLLTVVKAVVSGFIFGNLFMIFYSLAGAILSAFFMIILKKSGWFHVPVVSACGGIMHNMGQLLVALKTVDTYGVLYYAPMLIIAGLITGLAIGITASLLLPGLQNLLAKGKKQ